MSKLLVVDDEPKIREVIREYAEFNGHEVTEATDGMSAVGLCKLNDYDLVILDIMMPKLDGFSTCKEIKKIKDIPTIMLSARGEEYDKLFGFELGIDDYIVKPFSPKELMARINAVLNRKNAASSLKTDLLKFDGLEINIAARTVAVDGNRIELTPKEYDQTLSRQFVIDLAKPEDLKSMEEALKREKPVITYLINCAGYGLIDWLENLETAAQLRMIDVNCRALTTTQ